MKQFLLLFFSFVFSAPALANDWPEVREFELSVGFDYGAEQFHLNIPIYDFQGNALYWLICTGGRDAYLDKLSGDVNYVGPLSCVLEIENKNREFSLLGEDETPVWHTRGQFHSYQMYGACGDYPEFGQLRHFRLRGFELTLEITDVIIENDHPTYFLLNISLKNDANITSARTERPDFLSPRWHKCDVIKKGAEPLMCRNPETFSWEECQD